MGNDTANLIPALPGFGGAIISPVNSSPADVRGHIDKWQHSTFSFVLDPQLYYPKSERGELRQWSYFPAELDTADLTSEDWWNAVGRRVLDVATDLGVTTVCSPAACANQYLNGYYKVMTGVANAMVAENRGPAIWQTVLVRLSELTTKDRPREIASIVSSTKATGLYVVFLSDVPPRQEYTETEELKGAMLLIREIANAKLPVTVGFSGSEVILWRAAGAVNCATGKFFNLRRFTPGRFEDPTEGGKQVAYWFEESLLASLRESDLIRVQQRNLLSPASLANPHAQAILERLATAPGTAWVGLGWRQYMHWFADILRRMSEEGLDADALIASAETNWEALQDAKVFMEESRNDGRWLRPWRRALAEYRA